MTRRTDKEIVFQYLDRLIEQQAKAVDQDLLREILGTRTTTARLDRLSAKVTEALNSLRESRIRPYLAKRGL